MFASGQGADAPRSEDLLLVILQPLFAFAQQPLDLFTVLSSQRFLVGFQLVLYRFDSPDDMLGVLQQDAGPQVGVASSNASRVAKATASERLVGLGQCRRQR